MFRRQFKMYSLRDQTMITPDKKIRNQKFCNFLKRQTIKRDQTVGFEVPLKQNVTHPIPISRIEEFIPRGIHKTIEWAQPISWPGYPFKINPSLLQIEIRFTKAPAKETSSNVKVN